MEVYFAEFQQDGWTLQLGWQVFEECPDTAPLLQTNQAEISVTHCDENGLTCDPRDLLSAPTLGGCHPSIAVDYGLSGPDYPDPREELRDARVPGVQHDPIFGRSKSYTGLPFHIAKPDGSKDHFHIKCERTKDFDETVCFREVDTGLVWHRGGQAATLSQRPVGLQLAGGRWSAALRRPRQRRRCTRQRERPGPLGPVLRDAQQPAHPAGGQ